MIWPGDVRISDLKLTLSNLQAATNLWQTDVFCIPGFIISTAYFFTLNAAHTKLCPLVISHFKTSGLLQPFRFCHQGFKSKTKSRCNQVRIPDNATAKHCKQCWKDSCLILSCHPGICRPRKVWCFHPDYRLWNAILEDKHGILVCRDSHTWCIHAKSGWYLWYITAIFFGFSAKF